MKVRTLRIAATLGVALLALGCDIDITDTGLSSADSANDDGMEEGGGPEEGTEEGGSEVTDGGEEEGGPMDTGGEGEEGSEVSDGGEESEGGEDSGGLGVDCDPLAQDCVEGDACYPADDGALCAPIAQPAQAGDLCELINACSSMRATSAWSVPTLMPSMVAPVGPAAALPFATSRLRCATTPTPSAPRTTRRAQRLQDSKTSGCVSERPCV